MVRAKYWTDSLTDYLEKGETVFRTGIEHGSRFIILGDSETERYSGPRH